MDDRAQVRLVDVIMSLVVLIAIIATAPIWYTFLDMAASEADPLSALVLRLFLPLLFLALIISVGVSARGGSS